MDKPDAENPQLMEAAGCSEWLKAEVNCASLSGEALVLPPPEN
jgi:hypothetical protein